MRALIVTTALLAACGGPCDRAGNICTVVGVPGTFGYNGEGFGLLESWLYQPTALAWAPSGELAVNDYNNFRVRLAGDDDVLRTVVGNGAHAYALAGAPALETSLENAVDIAYGPDGALYIAELHGMRVLRVDGDAVVEEVAGVVGEAAHGGDDGPALSARMKDPSGVTVGDDGVVYISDAGNHCLRAVGPDGTMRALAGTPMTPGFIDGMGPTALNLPQHIRYHDGFVYIADSQNHAIRRYEVATGNLTTVAGTGTGAFSGDGGLAIEAALNRPYGVYPLDDGGLLIADSGNNRIRHVSPEGVISTIAGNGEQSWSGDEGDAVEAALAFPVDMITDDRGDVWVADMANGIIRRIARGVP